MSYVPGGTEMETASGLYMDLAAPDPSSVRLEDVAHHLSQTCRYTGATSRHYSVAEHAVLVALKLAHDGHSPLVQIAGLHHDDAEAYVGDNSRPLKACVPQLRDLERTGVEAVVSALGLHLVPFDDPAVKAADDWALAAEAWHLLPSRGRSWFCDGLYDPVGRYPSLWQLGMSAEDAERMWMREHRCLVARCSW